MMEYFVGNIWLFWVVVTVACLIMELTSGDFYVTCFAIGAVAGLVIEALGLPFWVQVLVFATVAVLSLLFVRPHLVHLLQANADHRVSNADALMGRIGRVSQTIVPGGYGRVQIDGDDWKAETPQSVTLSEGMKVRVVGRESIIISVVEA